VGWKYRRINTDSRYYFTPPHHNPRKFLGTFVNILFLKNQVTVTKGDNKRRKKLPTESKEEKKLQLLLAMIIIRLQLAVYYSGNVKVKRREDFSSSGGYKRFVNHKI
jgi:hypothetical protein